MLGQVITATTRPLMAAAAIICLGPQIDRQQPATPIRSGIVVVPLDVRVVDANGDPVTDLTAADFAVYENGVRQEVAHFIPLSFAGSGADEVRARLRTDHPLAAAATVDRTFVILLGRGRLNAPVKGLESLIAFIKGRLLPTDRVGVVAYLRASEPSTDHQAVIRFLERYRDQHEDLEGRIQRDFRHSMGLRTLSNDTRARIGALFGSGAIPAFTDLPGAAGQNASRYMTRTYLRRTIEVARRLAGEKHVIVLSERPFGLGRIHENPDDNVLVKWANEARVALSYINTGGLSGPAMIRGQLVVFPRDSGGLDASAMGISDYEFFAPTDYGLLARHTGGVSAFYRYASSPLEDLERASRFQYLLGYYPSVATSPNAYRTVRVVVDRPGVTPQYRHGYRLASSPDDEQQFRWAVAEYAAGRALSRVAGPEPRSLITKRLPPASLKISNSKQPYVAGARELSVSIAFDPMRVAFALEGTEYRATLYLAVLVDDADGRVVGKRTRPLDLALSSEESARARKHWLSVDVTVPVEGNPAHVRAAVYDYDSDRTMAGRCAIRPRAR